MSRQDTYTCRNFGRSVYPAAGKNVKIELNLFHLGGVQHRESTSREEHIPASPFQLEGGMKRIGGCAWVGLLALTLVGATAWAQATTAQISGTVKDQSGAVLPGVEIAVTQTATGAKRTAVSNETGNYVLARSYSR
ncbi:MAG: hypothetical protein DMG12_10865 [Acidobacteria bacterium]|nr:MAG: hypothetical protein DMG12_10865 [Acidobacteriota bacterium]